MRPPLLKQELLEPTNLVQHLASLDAISSWQNRKARKSSQNAQVLPLSNMALI